MVVIIAKKQCTTGTLRKVGESGVVTLEFALMVPFFLLLVIGILEFGHIWYIKHNLTIASREGARYGSSHDWPKPVGWTPSGLNPAIEDVVNSYLGPQFITDYQVTVTPQGAGYTSGNTGDDVVVVVTAGQNITIALHYLVPSLNNLTLGSLTTMKIE